MKRLSNIYLLALFSIAASTFTACSKDDEIEEALDLISLNSNDASKVPALARLEFPKVKGGNSVVLIHSTSDGYGINYSVEWDKDKKAQRWSCYQMNSSTCVKNTSRYRSDDNQYPFDPLLPRSDYLSQDCFWSSGFDHGHICPSADRLYSANANYQTFFLTNMQPQYPNFNGGEKSPWYRLEGQVRTWASTSTTEMLYVVKGGTIEDRQIMDRKIKGEMRIPQYFFVALLLKNKQGYKAVGFWMEHLSGYTKAQPLGDYAVNIDELEQKTGIDFFCNLPDQTEEHVESLPLENVKRAWGLLL
ncbi:MAG: DNA/RNA non-specific endonuclease [Prevotella sp.]|nr:DNA/RNA non-specific endonuclease [Prevotella sp.]